MSGSKYVVKLTLQQAKELGIVHCQHCRHPHNNHFNFGPRPEDQKCAHCNCPGYVMRFSKGKPITKAYKKVLLNKIQACLLKNNSFCMDDEEDRDALAAALVKALR
jgi:hypothetical protein